MNCHAVIFPLRLRNWLPRVISGADPSSVAVNSLPLSIVLMHAVYYLCIASAEKLFASWKKYSSKSKC
jgi:hypothetical protein